LAARFVFAIPFRGRGGRDFADEIDAFDTRRFAGEAECVFIGKRFRGEATAHGTAGAEVFGQSAGIDAADAGDAPPGEVFIQGRGGAPVADYGAKFRDGETAQVGARAFFVHKIDPVIADFRVGHGDDLPAVGRVGQDFLVTGHGSVEAHFARGCPAGTEGEAPEYPAILQRQFCSFRGSFG